MTRMLGFREVGQYALDLDSAARTPEELLARLVALGLTGIQHCRLTRNRAVMVSFGGGEIRLHESYLAASPDVLRAIVKFVCGRTRAERASARAAILAHPVERATATRRREQTHPDDEPIAERLTSTHCELNARFFGNTLRELPVRVSRRMKSRLGHYTAATPAGEPAEIVISRRHVKRHGWTEVVHTLLHEMVHQWQDENGQAIDHGAVFRRKARELGITAAARRSVTPPAGNLPQAQRSA